MAKAKDKLPEGTTFKFRSGCRVPAGVKPDTVAAELERIRRANGGVKPEDVIEAASDGNSPIHNVFDWDDSTAAHEYRLIQARQLIRAVVVIYPDTTPRKMYVHVNRPADDEENDGVSGVYQPMRLVVQDADMFDMARAALQGKLESARNSVNELMDVASEFGASQPRIKSVEIVRHHLDAATVAAGSVV